MSISEYEGNMWVKGLFKPPSHPCWPFFHNKFGNLILYSSLLLFNIIIYCIHTMWDYPCCINLENKERVALFCTFRNLTFFLASPSSKIDIILVKYTILEYNWWHLCLKMFQMSFFLFRWWLKANQRRWWRWMARLVGWYFTNAGICNIKFSRIRSKKRFAFGSYKYFKFQRKIYNGWKKINR